ncbi:MAG: NADPH:quinone oxidoreductase family protein [Cytophagales bacterium]|nr:MAG: NADPH:quinone oxidoreductase family protein [Cytophagales bacterium]
MKAILCKKWGTPDDLVLEEISSPTPKDHEVLISVKATGLNFPDVLMIAGKYQAKPPFPFIPCGEVSGIIKAVGKNITHLKEGMRVAALCGVGGLAEEVCVAATNVLPIPDDIDFNTAAAFMVVYGTAHVGLKHRAQLKKGETLLVHGAGGGVGLAAIDIGKHMGAKIVATASSAEKLAMAQKYGADTLINYIEEDFVEKVKIATNDKGADVIFDPVGGDVFDKSLKILNWEGRLLIVGFAGGRIPEAPANLLLLKNASLVGLFWGNYAVKNPTILVGSLVELLKLMQEGHLKPLVSQVFPLEKSAEALKIIENRQAIGKIVVEVQP